MELLAVEDYGADRIVIFRRKAKRPDDVMIVRFRKDEKVIAENPSFTLLEFEGRGSGFSSRDTYYDAQGNELN